MNTTISEIDVVEDLTRSYSRARGLLAERVESLEAELQTIKRRKLRGIRSALAGAQDTRSKLENAIAQNQHLFESPRTITVDGIRVGLSKGKGKVCWDDEARVVALIERHFPAKSEDLIKTIQKPIKAALGNLSIAELKKIACRVEETGDQIVVKPQDSALDKLIGRILDETKNLEEL